MNNKIIYIIIAMAMITVVAGLGLKTGRSKEEKLPVKTETERKESDFLGDSGKTVTAENGVIAIDESEVRDGNMHSFNYFSGKDKKTIYFFVVKASDGSYRVAANACEVCFGSKKGFSQVGDLIRCDNCRTTYSKDQIAMEKGGCNPRPIDNDAKVMEGRLLINIKDVEASAELF